MTFQAAEIQIIQQNTIKSNKSLKIPSKMC